MLKKILNKFTGDSLISAATWYTVGTFLLKGINFFTMPLYTKLLGLDTADYGITGIYSTYLGIISIFIGLGINGTLGTARANLPRDEYDGYISSTLFLSTLSFFGVFLLTIFFRNPISKFTELAVPLIILMVIQAFFDFVGGFNSSRLVFEKDYKKYLLISAISTLLNIGVSIVIILSLNNEKYLGRIYAGVIASVLIGIVVYINMMRKGKVFISLKHWKFCLPIALPLIVHNLSHMILTQSDRVMIQKYTTDSIVGLYNMSYNIGMIVNIILMSINSAWVAWYFDAQRDKLDKEIKEKAKIYIIVFTIFTGLFTLASPEMMKFLASKVFWPGIGIIPMVVLAYYFVFLYTFGVNYEFYRKKSTLISTGTMLAAIVNIVINFLLIPKIGGLGAAIATTISYALLFVFHEIIVRLVLKRKDFPFVYYIYALAAILVVMIFHYVFIDMMLVRWALIIIIIAGVLVNLKKVIK